MATRDAEPVFVDTNVLVYAHVAEAPWHQEAQEAIADYEAAGAPLWASRQVLREYLVSLHARSSFRFPRPWKRWWHRSGSFNGAFVWPTGSRGDHAPAGVAARGPDARPPHP